MEKPFRILQRPVQAADARSLESKKLSSSNKTLEQREADYAAARMRILGTECVAEGDDDLNTDISLKDEQSFPASKSMPQQRSRKSAPANISQRNVTMGPRTNAQPMRPRQAMSHVSSQPQIPVFAPQSNMNAGLLPNPPELNYYAERMLNVYQQQPTDSAKFPQSQPHIFGVGHNQLQQAQMFNGFHQSVSSNSLASTGQTYGSGGLGPSNQKRTHPASFH